MHRSKKRRSIVITSLLAVLLCMVVGYATYSSNIEIKGTTEVTSSWDIKITDVTSGTPTGDAENAKAPDWNDLTASVEANLYSKGDAMEYDVTITNNGTLDAKLDNIVTNLQNANDEAVIITFTGYKKGEVLKAKESKIVHIKIAYNPNYTGEETSSEVDIDFDFVQDNKNPDQPSTYMLTFDYQTNGGTRVDSEGEYLESGSNVNLSNKAYKDNWTFIGWNTNKDAKEALDSYQMPASETTLYAIYKRDLKATYEKGIGVESIEKTEDICTIFNNETSCEITLPSITPLAGYVSVGWSLINGDTTGTLEGTQVTLTDNTTYYANATDTAGPSIKFEPNTQNTFIQGGKEVTVTIEDASGIAANQSISYAWSTSSTEKPSFTNTIPLDNEEGAKTVSITIPENLSSNFTGSYYLWIDEGLTDTDDNKSEVAISEVFKFDNQDPTLTISYTATTSTITVVANANAASGISKYEYSKDDGKTWEDGGTNNTYTFTNLEQGTIYPIKVRVTSGVGKTVTDLITESVDITDNVTDTGDGLYEDLTEDNRYIYKGANPNNYVRFNNELWRIIAQESDNTLKIIKVNALTSRPFDSSNNRSSTYCNDSSKGCNAWGSSTTTYDTNKNQVSAISDTYSSNSTYALPTKVASMNDYLNSTYFNSLTETAQNQIDTHYFNVGTVSASTSNTLNTDMLEERKYKWLGKIGLLNLTDYVKSSTNSNCTKVSDYSGNSSCYNNIKTHNWIFDSSSNSPRFINGRSANRLNVWGINTTTGAIGAGTTASSSFGVKPVLYLKSTVKIISGEGTEDNPYELGTDGVSTATLTGATFTESGFYPKKVTIHFPEGCGNEYTCTYQKDSGDTVNVTATTVDVEFDYHGSIIANVSDGNENINTSYTVTIKLRAVDIAYDNKNTNLQCEDAQCVVDKINEMSK